MYYQNEIYTPDATIKNLRTQLNWTQEKCADYFGINVRTWQRWEQKNNISKAGKEFLFFKAGFFTDKRKNLFFGARYTIKKSQVLEDNFECIFMPNGEKIYESTAFIVNNLRTWLKRKNNENAELREELIEVKKLKKSSLFNASNDVYINIEKEI